MKKIIKKNKLLLCIFFVITLVLYIGMNNVFGCYFNMNRHSKKYSVDAVEFQVINNNNNNKVTLKDIINLLKDNKSFLQFSLHKKVEDKYIVRSIYKGSLSFMKFKLLKGTEFTDDDYNTGHNSILIKDKVYAELKSNKLIKLDASKEYLEYCGVKFYIKGVIDSSKSSFADDIYVNAYSIIKNENLLDTIESYSFIYDCGKDTRNNLKNTAQKYKNIEISISDIIKGQEALISSISINKIYVIAVVLLLVICFLTVGSVSSYWIRRETKELAIRKLVGARNSSLAFMIIKRYFTICITGMMSGMFSFEILKGVGILQDFINFETTLYDDLLLFIVALMIISVFLLTILIKPVVRVFKLQINTVIRGA